MGNYQTLRSNIFVLSTLWLVYYVSVLGCASVMRLVAMTLALLGENVFRINEYNMVEKFPITDVCGWFLYGKMAVWLNEASECLFPYRWSTKEVHWVIMGLRNMRELTRKDNKYNKDFKWLQWGSNTRRLSLKTNTQPLSLTGKIIELCC